MGVIRSIKLLFFLSVTKVQQEYVLLVEFSGCIFKAQFAVWFCLHSAVLYLVAFSRFHQLFEVLRELLWQVSDSFTCLSLSILVVM